MNSELSLLKLVFSFYIVDQIVKADQSLTPSEMEWVCRSFPREVLLGHGIINDSNILTPVYRDLLAEALFRLPTELSHEDKLKMLESFMESALVDGEFEARESHVIVKASRLLGVSPDLVISNYSEVIEASQT